MKQIRNILAKNDQPLAREAAARALGHMADPNSIDVLTTALGDSSKMVQRTSAWAIRMILQRPPGKWNGRSNSIGRGTPISECENTLGASQLFNQHFKYIAGDTKLRTALIAGP